MAENVQITANPNYVGAAPYPEALEELLDRDRMEAALRTISAWPDYEPTPLRSFCALARRTGVARIDYKDEGDRFGLGSFKALGGAYAVFRLIDRLGGAGAASDVTVCCATDGNHGRSVAWAAQLFGCRCVIFLHEDVSAGRQRAIERYGAEIVRVPGNYDASVEAAARVAGTNGWRVISDTSYPGYTDVPLDVMAGYSVMISELRKQLDQPPTHVFVQGGVGGLAAAVAAAQWLELGPGRPSIVVVEPEKAACLFESAKAGRPIRIEGKLDTMMAGLACGEVSLVAWTILAKAASHFMTISDESATAAMRALANGGYGDAPVVAGESAVAGLAGFIAAADNPGLRESLQLGPDSRVLFFGTESDTDPEIFERITGVTADAIRGRREAAGA